MCQFNFDLQGFSGMHIQTIVGSPKNHLLKVSWWKWNEYISMRGEHDTVELSGHYLLVSGVIAQYGRSTTHPLFIFFAGIMINYLKRR